MSEHENTNRVVATGARSVGWGIGITLAVLTTIAVALMFVTALKFLLGSLAGIFVLIFILATIGRLVWEFWSWRRDRKEWEECYKELDERVYYQMDLRKGPWWDLCGAEWQEERKKPNNA
jgi:hypothetical protein